jgi:tetrahydromethanopterin S-methyltransferase subunit A
LDLLVLLIKNWHGDPTIGFEVERGPQDVDKFGKAKEEILDLLDVEFFDEVDDHVEDCVQNWDMYP